MDLPRASGVVLHISSLPCPFGIGDLGAGARQFVDFLVEGEQRYWQILPFGPSCGLFANSPYMSFSAFAGNPLFIDLADLVDQGLLPAQSLRDPPDFSEYLVDYRAAAAFRQPLLVAAAREFAAGPSPEFADFRASAAWLDDYCLFMALRDRYREQPWHQWPREIAGRLPEAMASLRDQLAPSLHFHRFVQFQFNRQWLALRDYARVRGVRLIGDLPVYVGHDSADVWAHPGYFRLAPETFLPTHVAGVPPDYFSATGQRWGNPLYRWRNEQGESNRPLYDWWAARLGHLLGLVDLCRIDHFRGFESLWEIAAEEETAVNGRWIPGPGPPFFEAMRDHLGDLPIIAEDLGIITPAVTELRRRLGLPGMRVLQFAFDFDPRNAYLPHNFSSTNTVVYTGTHDNNTTLGWFLGPEVDERTRELVRRYTGSDGRQISRDLIRLALSSVARLAIFPLQDVLGFGADCRMNTPGTSEGNWRWRCAGRFLTGTAAAWLREETILYNRSGRQLEDSGHE
jgi:4-alpha-glucanotransferase